MIATIAMIATMAGEWFPHMIAAIATIAEIELKSISAIVVAAIAGEWFPYDRCVRYDRLTFFFQQSERLYGNRA